MVELFGHSLHEKAGENRVELLARSIHDLMKKELHPQSVAYFANVPDALKGEVFQRLQEIQNERAN